MYLGVVCKECGCEPVKGVLYKCTQCREYDLCESCESKTNHRHIFLKIKKLKHKPIKILV